MASNNYNTYWYLFYKWAAVTASSFIQLSATGRLLDITLMCYEYRTPLLPCQLRQPRQSDLSVTSTLQSVNWWHHDEYSCCSHPSRFYSCGAHLLSRSDKVWWSDLIGQDAVTAACPSQPSCSRIYQIPYVWLTNHYLISKLWASVKVNTDNLC